MAARSASAFCSLIRSGFRRSSSRTPTPIARASGRSGKRVAEYWADPKAHPEIPKAFTSLEAARIRHQGGSPHPERYDPALWEDEYSFLSRPGQQAIQEALLYDYRTNVAAYPAWQEWLREHKPPTLVVWGGYDASFIAAGGEAYKRDLPDAEVHILEAGHFALDEKVDEIAALTLDFLSRRLE